MSFQAEAVVDLDTIAANVDALVRHVDAAVMPAVKADAYGHGLVPTARACLSGGASRLGVATLDEAMTLRGNGIAEPILAWLVAPGLDVTAAIDAGVELGAGSAEQLSELAAAGARRKDVLTPLACFIQFTDLHVVDVQSPLRTEYL
ncbi:MAG: alanine racemase, partial [Stackebrandtia sp.]